jgi:hypothetical protein
VAPVLKERIKIRGKSKIRDDREHMETGYSEDLTHIRESFEIKDLSSESNSPSLLRVRSPINVLQVLY